jgi:hypothetical protein
MVNKDSKEKLFSDECFHNELYTDTLFGQLTVYRMSSHVSVVSSTYVDCISVLEIVPCNSIRYFNE